MIIRSSSLERAYWRVCRMVRNFNELLKDAASVGPKRIAVAAANDAQTLTA